MSSYITYKFGLNQSIQEEYPDQESLKDRQLQIIFETALDGMAIADDQGRYLDVNPAACELFGLDRDKLLGRYIWEFVEPEFDFQITWEKLPQQEKVQGEIRFRRLDGEIRIVEYAATANFSPHCHLSVMRDITRRKQAEAQVEKLTQELAQAQAQLQEAGIEPVNKDTPLQSYRLKQLAQHIPGVIYQFRMRPDGTCHFPYASEGVREIHNVSPEELLEDASKVFAVVHPEDLDRVHQSIQKSASELSPWFCEYRVCLPDGRILWLFGHSTPQRERDGSILWHGYIRDISDRKQAEAELKEVSERLSFALKSGKMGCWEWDIVENTLVWDDRMYELYGVTKESDSRLAYDIWATGLHPDDREATEVIIRQAVLGQAEYDPEFRVVHPDGSVHFIKAFGLVRRDAQGNAQKMIGLNFDISDRKQTEILLKQSQKRYQTLAEASPIGVFLTDAKGDCLYVNQTWLQITGLSQEKALGPNWSITLHPEDREQVFREWYESALNKKQFESEYRFLRPDGSVTWVIGQALALIDNQGEIEGYVGTITDITDRKRQEQALRLIVEGTAAKTGEAFFKSCVQYLAQVLEVRYAFIAEFVDSEKLIAKTLAFWAGDGFGDNFTYNLVGAPCEQVNSQNDLCIYPHSLQSLFPENDDLVALQAESYAGVPIIDANGNSLGFLAVLDTKPMVEEITIQSAILRIFATRAGAEIERIEAEAVRRSEIKLRQKTEELEATLKQLQATQLQLIQAEKMSSLGQLVAGIAHEINNPVNFIYGNIQTATDYATNLVNLIQLYQEHYPSPLPAIADFTENIDFEYVASDFPKLLTSVKNGATRIRDIVKSLRTFSRLDEADLKEIDIHENIESTLVILQNRLNGRAGNPEIHVHKNYGKLPLIECYGGLLNQVFMNLLVNAIDAIEQQRESLEPTEKLDYQGQITITTSITSENQVFISIQDNGAGMSPQVQEKIFNPFFTTKAVGKGTGMGLAISYQIVTKNHQGDLQCFSRLGQGTEFRMELPICDVRSPSFRSPTS
ncbi:PAS domain S-box protein [Aerosakkonemataceae cyanobacterium BLCC-F50]|uniref:histidine kinase n=1 Tax=Floridaenema flaviceps BLCC-F50 TaxID=3153642 RepID=A0ABV4XP91_9CYAN